jgi:hypothetical protein
VGTLVQNTTTMGLSLRWVDRKGLFHAGCFVVLLARTPLGWVARRCAGSMEIGSRPG